MGSGKSTFGRKLARELHLPFIDLDQEIVSVEKQTIAGIISEQGEAYFREIESAILKQLNQRPAVIATGGGTPCFFDNMDWMLRHGITIYLRATPAFLHSRLLQTNREERPLLKGLSSEELMQYIEMKLMEREPNYARAHLIADAIRPDEIKNELHNLRHSDR